MFERDERVTLLMLLWNFKQEATHAMESGMVAAEDMEAAKVRLAGFDAIVTKLGGDPTKAAFGADAI